MMHGEITRARTDRLERLMKAVAEDDADLARALLKAGAPMAQAMPNGAAALMMALMMACQEGHLQCVRALLEAGAPVKQAMQDGFTALMEACQYGHEDCVRALL
jgi:ankyrin repeat protein